MNKQSLKFQIAILLIQTFLGTSLFAQVDETAAQAHQPTLNASGSDIYKEKRLLFGAGIDPRKITHCYHYISESWQNKRYLTAKYEYAQKNPGDFLFFAGSNGQAGGPGTYCAKTLTSSIMFGDRVIRIELADDVVIQDNTSKGGGIKYCRYGGDRFVTSKDDEFCAKKEADLSYFKEDKGWYVIKAKPKAKDAESDTVSSIKEWSAGDALLISDIQETINAFSGADEETRIKFGLNDGKSSAEILTRLKEVLDVTKKAQPKVYRPVSATIRKSFPL